MEHCVVASNSTDVDESLLKGVVGIGVSFLLFSYWFTWTVCSYVLSTKNGIIRHLPLVHEPLLLWIQSRAMAGLRPSRYSPFRGQDLIQQRDCSSRWIYLLLQTKIWNLPCVIICENNKYGMGTSAACSSSNTECFTRGDRTPGPQVTDFSSFT